MGSRICVLKDGQMQQLDTPQNLYDKPDNVFVAGFIGSPAMNFFDVTVVEEDGNLYADAAPSSSSSARKVGVGSSLCGQAGHFWHSPREHPRPRVRTPGIHGEPLDVKVDVTELMATRSFST